MLSEISQTEKEKYCMISLNVESKKAELINRVEWWLPGIDGGENNVRDIGQRFSRWLSSIGTSLVAWR